MLHKPQYRVGYVGRHQKTYLSREMTRALATEYPIGDPHGGPAYGDRNEPVSAIIAITTMVSTGGAVLAGTASLMTGLAFAGAAISLVGNITGNKTLSKIGMVTGMVGGIGALVESVGGFTIGATMGETFGYGANAANAAGNTAAQALSQSPVDDIAVQTANTVDDAAAVVGDAVPDMRGVATPNSAPVNDYAGLGASAPTNPAAAPKPPINDYAGLGSNVSQAGAPQTFGAQAPSAPGLITSAAPTLDPYTAAQVSGGNAGTNALLTNPMDSLAQAVSSTPSDILTAAGSTPPSSFTLKDYVTKGWQGVKDIGSGLMDAVKGNPEGAKVLASVAGGVADWLSGKSDAEIADLEAKGELSKAQADRLRYEVSLAKQRKAQLNQNYASVGTPLQVNPGAVTLTQPGLVAGAMPRP